MLLATGRVKTTTPATRGNAVTLTTWPGSEERVVATAGAHGTDVRRNRS